MSEYIEREAAIDRLVNLFQLQAATARAIIEAIPAADVRPVKWIPVTDRLPEDGTLLGKLICDSEGHIRIATQFARIGLKDKWVYTDLIDMVKFLAEEVSEPISEWEDCTHITHWMPLPEPPKEE